MNKVVFLSINSLCPDLLPLLEAPGQGRCRNPRLQCHVRSFPPLLRWQAICNFEETSPQSIVAQIRTLFKRHVAEWQAQAMNRCVSVRPFPARRGIVVTTTHKPSLTDVRKSIDLFRKSELPVVGILANLNGPVCPHCRGEVDIFDEGKPSVEHHAESEAPRAIGNKWRRPGWPESVLANVSSAAHDVLDLLAAVKPAIPHTRAAELHRFPLGAA